MKRDSEDTAEETVRPKKVRWRRVLLIVLASPLLLFLLYTEVVLHWSYSTGERAGYVQKFSKKGWFFKTWEGELAMVSIPGTLAEKFHFTVPEDSVAAKINATMGRKVALTYEQHLGLPTKIFGESEYFVIDVKPFP
jgi:hypothetical protein